MKPLQPVPARHLLPRLLLPTLAFLLVLLLRFSLTTLAAEEQPQALQALGSIAGMVTDSNQQPLAGIVVSLLTGYGDETALQITTTATGAFRFAPLFPGIYRLGAHDPGGLFATQYFTATNNAHRATDIIVNGNPVTGLAFVLQRAGRITGRVTIGGSAPPVVAGTNNNVMWYGESPDGFLPLGTTPIISTTGQYTIDGLFPAPYRLCAAVYLPAAGYINSCYGGVTLEDAETLTVTAGGAATAKDIDLEAGQFDGVIGGQVTVAGAPAANIRVDLQGSAQFNGVTLYTMTNRAGAYAFHRLPAGSYSALFTDPADRYPRIWHDGRPAGPGWPSFSYQQPLTLKAGEVLSDLDVSLLEYAAIQGKVWRQTPPLQAGEQITVLLYYQYDNTILGTERYPQVDASGNYSITRLLPGSYLIGFAGCYALPMGWACIYRYYGAGTDGLGTSVLLQSGARLTGINSLIGLDPVTYLPLVLAATE